MDFYMIYLIGVVLALFGVIFLIERNAKDTARFSFGFKLFFVVLCSASSWLFVIGMSANLLGKKFKI